MKAMFVFGAPLDFNGKRYTDRSDQSLVQKNLLVDKVLTPFKDRIMVAFNGEDETGFKVTVVSEALDSSDFRQVLLADGAFVIGALGFVFLFSLILLRSLFLAVIGVVTIALSVPLTVLIAKGIFQVLYTSNLHMVLVFIVIGLAADNFFVFADAWRQSATVDDKIIGDNMHRRMAYTVRRAARAMLVTSSTTAGAFLANSFSPIMPIKSLGIYGGIIVPVNAIMVLVLFPPATIAYEIYVKPLCRCRVACCPDDDLVENHGT